MKLSMSSAVVPSPWRLKSTPKALIQFSRWLSSPDASQLPLALHPPPPSESMFGLAPRKRVAQDDLDREDFVGRSNAPMPESSHNAEQENYFSKVWADQKILRRRQGPGFAVPQLPSRKARSLFQTEPLLLAPLPLSKAPQPEDLDRAWIYASDMPSSTQERFVIASYNVLASTYAHKHRYLYAHVPSRVLDWKNRKRKILFELGLYSPDIICLQEVDRVSDLQVDLGVRGYDVLYKVRTGGAPDGCAIFWRKERFRLLHEESLEFSGLEMRENVAQLCVFQPIVSGSVNDGSVSGPRVEGHGESKILVVGNINVLFNPKRGDIKLGQCRAFLEQAHKLSSSWHGAPVVVGGSFNLTPSSVIYDFLANSELDVSGMDRRYISGQITRVARSGSTNSSFNGATKSGDAIENVSLSSISRLGTEVSDNRNNIETFKDTLKLSIKARFASKQKKYATEFASAATEAVGVCNKDSLDGPNSVCTSNSFFQGNQCSSTVNRLTKEQTMDKLTSESAKEDEGDNAFLSRTIKILEGSLRSPISYQQGSQNGSPTSKLVQEDEITSGSSVGVDLFTKAGMVQAGTCSESHKNLHDIQANPLKSDLSLGPAAEVGIEESVESRVSFVQSSKQGAVINSVQAALSEILEATHEPPTQSGKPCTERNANSAAEYLPCDGVRNMNANYEGGSTDPFLSRYQTPSHDVDQQLTRSATKTNHNSLDANLNTGSMEGHSVHAKEQNRKFETSNILEEVPCENSWPSSATSDRQTRSVGTEAQTLVLVENRLEQCSNPISLGTSEDVSSASELITPLSPPGSWDVNNVVSPERLDSRQLDSTVSCCNSVLGMPENNSEVERDHGNDTVEEHQWDLEELKIATGNPDCTTVRHKLDLHSVYSEIPGRTGTRDAKGEPLITRYQSQFSGCVDYIWRTDGLKPVKVLDTIPLEKVMLNRGFPSKAWGSDHLVIACELAFSPSKTELDNNELKPGT